jgi:hypothetical protein
MNRVNRICLVVLPHQDDEFFLLPYIEEIIRKGGTVRFIYVTNGKYANHTPETRAKETVNVLSKYYIQKESIIFLGHSLDIEDAEVVHKYDDIYAFLKIYIANNLSDIGQVITTAWEGGHHDHDALNYIIKRIGKKLNIAHKIFEFHLYNSANSIHPLFRVMRPIEPAGEKDIIFRFSLIAGIKATLCAFSYKSQWKTFIGLLPQASIALLLVRKILISNICNQEKITAPHPGIPLYERRKRFSYSNLKIILESKKHDI